MEEAYQNSGFSQTSIKDVEERQRILKDRLFLIGKNLIELREENQSEIIELKKDVEILKQNMKRLIKFLEIASTELTQFAKKEDLEILAKKMEISK